jgi:hypothetical protein
VEQLADVLRRLGQRLGEEEAVCFRVVHGFVQASGWIAEQMQQHE